MALYHKEEKTIEHTDANGKVSQEKQLTQRVVSKDRAQEFLNLIKANRHFLYKLSENELKTLIALGFEMEINGNNSVDISSRLRNEICKDLDISDKTLRNILSKLRNKGALLATKTSEEYLDPGLVYRGQISKSKDQSMKFSMKVQEAKLAKNKRADPVNKSREL